MAFHRLTVPTYFGGLPGGYDYINNALVGTPSAADAAKVGGPNVGTYFVAHGEDATAADFNRPARALAENCDALDDLMRRDIAVPTRTVDVFTGVPVAAVILVGPGIFLGKTGHPDTPEGRKQLFEITDANDVEIVDALGVDCVVTATSDVIGSGFSAGNVTLTITPAIPAGKTYRVYYGVRTNLATMPIDALTSLVIRNAQEVSALLEAPGGAALIGTAGSGNWADGTTNPATNVEAQLDSIIVSLAFGTSGGAKISGAAVAGTYFNLAAGTLNNQFVQTYAALNTLGASTYVPDIPGGRLSGSVAPYADAGAGLATIYYTPYKHGIIYLYNGTNWVARAFAQISVALAGLVAGNNYDVFARWNGAAVVLELGSAWASDTARGGGAAALAQFTGTYVKSGDSTSRYIGTIRATGATSTADSVTQRFIWNMYNQEPLSLQRSDSTDTWTYVNPAATWRSARGTGTNLVELICGDPVGLEMQALSIGYGDGVASFIASGIGIDSQTVNSAMPRGAWVTGTDAAPAMSAWRGVLALGRHIIYWLETGSAVQTYTFYGDGGTTAVQCGLTGSFRG